MAAAALAARSSFFALHHFLVLPLPLYASLKHSPPLSFFFALHHSKCV